MNNIDVAQSVGSPYPLGATCQNGGVNFALTAPRAHRVILCIEIDNNWHEYEFSQQLGGVWYRFIPEAQPGCKYGYRVDGPWNPRGGQWFNPKKFLLDPYARQISGNLTDLSQVLAYENDVWGEPSTINSLGTAPYGIVTDTLAYTARSSQPRIPWEHTTIYEAHIASLTALHPDVPPEIRGTYLGACHEAIIDHLHALKITSIEFLPLQACITEPSLVKRSMRNHWGYSTGAFFAPDPRYASAPGKELEECAQMIDTFHQNGIEVIMDVVYNHTCEAGETGSTISWRGIDAQEYYLISETGEFFNYSGTGNTLDCSSPTVVRMLVDSLRYWVEVMKVDGFRFDLASVIGRGSAIPSPTTKTSFSSRAPGLTAITADPVLQRCKLIAEPWDATAEGYQVGNFGSIWAEWNDHFRDTVRRFWIGESNSSELATRLSGSEDVFAKNNRSPFSSINFVTAHDGYTLEDLVSYTQKHNEANGEENRDGNNTNYSTNHGVEGETTDPAIIAARDLHKRNLLTSLILAKGTPMLLMGDEIGHSHKGNNNAYCVPLDKPADQAYALDWEHKNDQLLAFISRLMHIRTNSPVLEQPHFFAGRGNLAHQPEIIWFNSTGHEMADEDWEHYTDTLIAWLDGNPESKKYPQGTVNPEDILVIYHNGATINMTVPLLKDRNSQWNLVLDTTSPDGAPNTELHPPTISPGQTLYLNSPTVLIYYHR